MSKSHKKYIVLFILFIFPIVIYLFFASGKNNFALLPVLTSVVDDVHQWETLTGKSAQFQDRITILGFWGEDLSNKKGDALNLNQKIYKRFYQFKDFHLLWLLNRDIRFKLRNSKKN